MATNIKMSALVVEKQNETKSWEQYKQRFEIAIMSVDFGKGVADGEAKVNEVSKRKAAALLNNIGDEGMRIFFSFGIKNEDLRYDMLIERFDTYFGTRENKTILRHRLWSMMAEEGESLVDYVDRVRTMAEKADLGNKCSDMAVHIILRNMKEEQLKKELLQIEDLDMDKVITKCTLFESARRTLEVMDGNKGELDVVQKKREKRGTCYNCGAEDHFMNCCPQIECYRCKQRGHISSSSKCKYFSASRGRGGFRENSYRGRGGQRGSFNNAWRAPPAQNTREEEHQGDHSGESL